MIPGHVLRSSLFGYTGHTKYFSLHSFFFMCPLPRNGQNLVMIICTLWSLKRLHKPKLKLSLKYILIDHDHSVGIPTYITFIFIFSVYRRKSTLFPINQISLYHLDINKDKYLLFELQTCFQTQTHVAAVLFCFAIQLIARRWRDHKSGH